MEQYLFLKYSHPHMSDCHIDMIVTQILLPEMPFNGILVQGVKSFGSLILKNSCAFSRPLQPARASSCSANFFYRIFLVLRLPTDPASAACCCISENRSLFRRRSQTPPVPFPRRRFTDLCRSRGLLRFRSDVLVCVREPLSGVTM